jgi:hypothetical protein
MSSSSRGLIWRCRLEANGPDKTSGFGTSFSCSSGFSVGVGILLNDASGGGRSCWCKKLKLQLIHIRSLETFLHIAVHRCEGRRRRQWVSSVWLLQQQRAAEMGARRGVRGSRSSELKGGSVDGWAPRLRGGSKRSAVHTAHRLHPRFSVLIVGTKFQFVVQSFGLAEALEWNDDARARGGGKIEFLQNIDTEIKYYFCSMFSVSLSVFSVFKCVCCAIVAQKKHFQKQVPKHGIPCKQLSLRASTGQTAE